MPDLFDSYALSYRWGFWMGPLHRQRGRRVDLRQLPLFGAERLGQRELWARVGFEHGRELVLRERMPVDARNLLRALGNPRVL